MKTNLKEYEKYISRLVKNVPREPENPRIGRDAIIATLEFI